MIYLVSYDFGSGTLFKNRLPFYAELQRSGQWWHFLDRTWLIYTQEPLAAVDERLRTQIDSRDRLLIVQITNNTGGWLPAEAWQWIRERIFLP